MILMMRKSIKFCYDALIKWTDGYRNADIADTNARVVNKIFDITDIEGVPIFIYEIHRKVSEKRKDIWVYEGKMGLKNTDKTYAQDADGSIEYMQLRRRNTAHIRLETIL